MKNKLVYSAFFAATLASCAGNADNTDESLEALRVKQAELKSELAAVNEQILAKDTTKSDFVPLVTATKVRVEDFVHKVKVPGTVETDKIAMVTAEANGVIKQIHVKDGQSVSKGQTLVTLDAEILASSIEEVKTSLELAEYMFKKQQKLMDEGVGVEIEYEQAKNQKLSLEQKLKTMRSQIGKTVVRAPFAGVVEDLMVNEGEMAAPQVPLLRLVNNKSVTINASITESLLSKVNEGTPVEMDFPSLDTTIVSAITNKGNFIDPVNRTFRIQVEINNNKILLPNQFAELRVTDFVKDSATVVDSEAILQDTDNNNYVYRLTKAAKGEDGQDRYTVEKIFVEIIKKYKGVACIQGAINENDLIVVKGAKGITPSDQVKIQ